MVARRRCEFGSAIQVDEEQPCVDCAAEKARDGGGDQPVQATSGRQQEGEPGNADEHGGDRVRREPFDVAGHALGGTGSEAERCGQRVALDRKRDEQQAR